VHYYGGPLFADRLAADLRPDLCLLEPADDWLPGLPLSLVGRRIHATTLGEARSRPDRVFVKPPSSRSFTARVVVDVGLTGPPNDPRATLAVVEANMAWFSQIYMSDPARALDVVLRAAGPAADVRPADRPFLRPHRTLVRRSISDRRLIRNHPPPAKVIPMTTHYTFPGRWLAATAMVFGPVLLLVAVLLRWPFHYFFPDQLAAVVTHPALMTAAHTAFIAGTVLLAPAVIALAHQIGRTRPILATWAAGLVLVGLFERTFHAGIDQAAHGLARHHGAEFATDLVSQSYQDMHLFSFLSFTILFGWLVLAFAAYRSSVLGPVRAVALAGMCLLPLGVLKGTEITSVIAIVGLCVALVPGGLRLASNGPRPSRRSGLITLTSTSALAALAYASTLG
jgi:hypothetical protein